MLSFKPTFSLSSYTFIKRLFSSSSLSAIRVVICISEVIDISPGNLDSSLCFFQLSVFHDVLCIYIKGFPCGSAGKESACNAEDLGLIPGLGRSPGEGKGYPLHYSGLENSMDSIVHGVTKSWTELSAFHFHFTLHISTVLWGNK